MDKEGVPKCKKMKIIICILSLSGMLIIVLVYLFETYLLNTALKRLYYLEQYRL